MMEWSDPSVMNEFRIKVFLDTNILIYLIDNKSNSINYSLELLKNSEFVELSSSRFVIFEFIGVRKKEHYCRIVVDQQRETSSNKKVNYSSLIKNIGRFEDHIGGEEGFKEIIKKVREEVNRELESITKDFEIEYSNNLLHNDLLGPTFDICLSSKISKEDSLVLLSALFPSETRMEDKISILTNDSGFVSGYEESILSPILESHSLVSPHIESISGLKVENGTNVDLHNDYSQERLEVFWQQKILEKIVSKNKKLFLGITFAPKNIPGSIICFKLNATKELTDQVYITILSKNLNFLYTSKHKIEEFWNNGVVLKCPFISENVENISFRIQEESEGNLIDLPKNIIDMLRADGNYVFLHPDN